MDARYSQAGSIYLSVTTWNNRDSLSSHDSPIILIMMMMNSEECLSNHFYTIIISHISFLLVQPRLVLVWSNNCKKIELLHNLFYILMTQHVQLNRLMSDLLAGFAIRVAMPLLIDCRCKRPAVSSSLLPFSFFFGFPRETAGCTWLPLVHKCGKNIELATQEAPRRSLLKGRNGVEDTGMEIVSGRGGGAIVWR